MRLLSILCGLSFSMMAGYLLACWTAPGAATQDLSALDQALGAIFWVPPVLALLGMGLALKTRAEGWAALASGNVLFLAALLLLPMLGAGAAGLLCLVAAGRVLITLVQTPSSYWRVVG